MTRLASTNNGTELAREAIQIFIAVDLDFPSGHVRAHDGVGTMTFGGNDYLGVGSFGGIEVAEEAIDLVAKPVKLTLSGVDPSLISSVDSTSPYQGRIATVYMGLVNRDTGTLIDTPETLWEGRMDTMTVSLGPKTGSITLNCEHRLRREPRIARYTNQDQQLAYSGDRFFDVLPKIAGFNGTWGAKGAANDGASLAAASSRNVGQRYLPY
jgi:hypothetical protein